MKTTKFIALNDWKSENLKGSVYRIVTETYLLDSISGKIGILESKGIETFDENGYTVTYNNFTTTDSVNMIYNYIYNASGFLTGMTVTKNGKPSSSMKIDVDTLGVYMSATSFDSAAKVDAIYTEIQTNKFGQVLSANGLHPDSTLKMSFTNKYDSIFYMGGESKDSVGKVTYSSTIALNDNKDPAAMDETDFTKNSYTTNTVYTYSKKDSEGNWTEQTITVNGKPSKLIKRTISYFK